MGETRIVEEVRTGAGREAAFAYVADFDHQAAWDPNTVSSRRLTDPPLAVGSRFVLVVRMGRGTLPMEYRITRLDPPERVVLVGEGRGIWTEDTIELWEDGDGTRVRYAATIRLGGLPGVIQPLLGRAFEGIGRGAAEGLLRQLDALPTEDA